MDINSYNKYQVNSIRRVNNVHYVSNSNGDSVVAKIQAVKEVMPGFNPATLYLVKLAKALRNKDKITIRGKKIKEMTLEEFEEFILTLQDDFSDNENSFSSHMKDEQMLLMQDLLSAVTEDENTIFGVLPIVIDEDIENMNNEEFKNYLYTHKEMIQENGLIYVNYDELSSVSDEKLLEYKKILISRLREVKDLFYYNKAMIGYEKSYDNIAEINSNGLKA